MDGISRIDLYRPSAYKYWINHPTSSVLAGSIPGKFILSCDLPTLSIKQDDDFFANEAQDISISVFYDAELEAAFRASQAYYDSYSIFDVLVNGYGIDGKATKELESQIIVIYDNNNNQIFHGVTKVAGKSFDAESFVISFSAYDLMKIFKDRAELKAGITYLQMSETEFDSIIANIYSTFGNSNKWEISPITVDTLPSKMTIGDFNGSTSGGSPDILKSIPYSGVSEMHIYNDTGAQLALIFKDINTDHWRYVRFFITNPWNILIFWDDYIQPHEDWHTIGEVLPGFTEWESGSISNLQGVDYTIDVVQGSNPAIRLLATNGSWTPSTFKIKTDTTNGEVIKFFLLVCGWKMYMKNNTLKMSKNLHVDGESYSTITIQSSKIKGIKIETVEQYDDLDSSLFDILDESADFVATIKALVEARYNNYLSRINKEASFSIHYSAGVTDVGVFVILPQMPSPAPNLSDLQRTYYIYAIKQNIENTDWYDCEAFNIDWS